MKPFLSLSAAIPLFVGASAVGVAPLAGQSVAAKPASGSYHVTRRVKLGGTGSWDYVAIDTATNRLFIAREDRMMVIDPRTGRVLGDIPGLHRGHGVAFAYPTGHGFVTSGADSTVTMFDLKTLRVLGTTKAAVDDDAVLYDPTSRDVFTFNGDAESATVIDATSGKRVGTIPLGGKPEFGVSGNGKLYVNIADKNEVVEINPTTRQITRRWSISPCTESTGLAIDVAHHLLFSGCRNKVMAISDAVAGKLITTVPIGSGVDANAFDPATGDAFASNGDGTLTVVHEDTPNTFHVVQNVPTMPGARTMALDPRMHIVYTVSAQFGPAPAAATKSNPRRYPPVLPGSFTLLVVQR